MIDMKPVHASLKKWMQANENFQEHFAKLKHDILSDPSIREIIAKNPQLTHQVIEKNLNTFYEYHTQSKHCSTCTSLDQCSNIVKGYTPVINVEEQSIHLSYIKCRRLVKEEKQREQKQLIESLYMPREILEATYNDIDGDIARLQAIREMNNFIDKLPNGIPEKGIYFTGPFGVGKTYLLGALANKLKEYNISSMLIYMPEFVREIRDSFKDDSINKKVNYFKKADVLMLDDIGAETQSAWFRDEILGSILQYRMMERLPVFFTSNYTMDQLEEQLAKSTRGDIEKVKAGRIMERIRQVSIEVPIRGENRRYY